MRETELRETTKRWIARYLSVDGEAADWVFEPKGAIKKDNLTFTAKFLWLIVRHCLCPQCYRKFCHLGSVLMAAMITGFGGLRLASSGGHAREGLHDHYYLPISVHGVCFVQVRRCAYLAH